MKFELRLKTVFAPKMLGFALLGLTSFAFAQQPGASAGLDGKTSKGAVMKGKVPVSREALKVRLPKPQEATLPNGLRVALLENHKVPTFSMQLIVRAGGVSEPADRRSLAFFTASMLREGTTTRTAQQISEQIESIGATFNAAASPNSVTSVVATSGLIENFDPTLGIFADAVRNPLFQTAELERLKTRNKTQIQLQRGVPQLTAYERFSKAVYGAHPAATLFASPEAMSAITADDLKRFHQSFYRPNNAHLIVVGSITMKELLPKLEKAFGDWQRASVPEVPVPTAKAPEKAGVFLINRPGSVQTVLWLGGLGVERLSPDFYAVQVMNQILGGGANARLFLNLRENKGYTYGAYSNATATKFGGMVWADAEVRTEVTADALKEFMYELTRLREENASPAELENAKRSLTGRFALSLEQPQALLANVNTQLLYDLPPDYWDKYPQRIASVTAADVRRVAGKYYDPSRLQIVAVGDAAKIKDALAKYGAVEQSEAEAAPGGVMIPNRNE